MISLKGVKFKHLEKLALDNSPLLLTAVGVAGVVATAVLTHRAATKSERMLFNAQQDKHDKRTNEFDYILTRKESFNVVWKNYIPPVLVGTLTVTSIVGANRIGSKRAAALAAAYTLSERSFEEYRAKVVEKIGENKARAVQDEIAQDRVRANPPGEVILVGTGDVRCCDLMSMRYFQSSVEGLRKAANEVNFQILHNGYASLTDFYNEVGLSATELSEELGWNQDNLLELEFSSVLAEDGQPCLAYRFQVKPIRGYHRIHP